MGKEQSPQDGTFPEYSIAAIQKLDDVVEEMVARRKSKAKRNSTAKLCVFVILLVSKVLFVHYILTAMKVPSYVYRTLKNTI
jgi:hypothetical protein